ncbi:MAG: hypothetical protein JW861_07070, partial [Bacteroidales bacterium]|nr:hypothetical protein [Bacteroidales bacterium]
MKKENIKTLNPDCIYRILERNDKRVVFDKTNVVPDHTRLYEQLKKYIRYDKIGRKSVLGLDMYQYSSYPELEQTLIPYLFKIIFEATIKLCFTNHRFIFQKYTGEQLRKSYISTGDGGFVIFHNPLHAVLFACNFAIILRAYNSYHYYPRLRNIIGAINMRYAITYDKIYTFNKNYYGRAIINNARILIKDSLNRCLIDEHVHSWFMTNLDGVENLQIATLTDISNIHEFSSEYDPEQLKYGD